MLRSLIAACLLLCSTRALEGAQLIEMTVGKKVIVGRELIRNEMQVVMMGQDGRVTLVEPNKIVKRSKSLGEFRPWPGTVVRDRLLRELGSGYAAANTRHYIVAARNSKLAERYAKIFEQTYLAVHQYFAVRGVKQTEPEFMMVAIVFPNHAAFAKYSANDEVTASRGLQGYYHNLSNRVALFEDQANTAEADIDLEADDDFAWLSISGNNRNTVIHEATHQVAFNTGLHRRLGSNPKWLVEGLATVFENSGIRNAGTTASNRINPERFVWFGSYKQQRRKPKSLASVITSDALFEANALDAYSEGWALSFYLMETRSRDYSKYLSAVARRDQFSEYTPQQKLADFQAAFGKDMGLLEAQYLRFISGLKK